MSWTVLNQDADCPGLFILKIQIKHNPKHIYTQIIYEIYKDPGHFNSQLKLDQKFSIISSLKY